MSMVGLFSYWDTFRTFLPVFLQMFYDTKKDGFLSFRGVFSCSFFILPVLVLLPLTAKLADRYGRYPFMLLGLLLTAGSVFLVGAVPFSAFFFFSAEGLEFHLDICLP